VTDADASPNHVIEAFSATGLDHLQIYADGRPLKTIKLSGKAASIPLAKVDFETGTVTAFAADLSGIVSAPLTLSKQPLRRKHGNLYAIAVGVDRYPLLPPICGKSKKESCNLSYAAADARRVTNSVMQSMKYEKKVPILITNDKANRKTVLDALDTIVAEAGSNDTIVVSFAGHGFRYNDKLLIGMPTTLLDNVTIESTSLPFEMIAEKLRCRLRISECEGCMR
jgi:hypothetical protein